jgi:ABC-type glycerol-3-phosphate transport system permease component
VSCIFDFVQWIDTILSKEVERRKRGMLKKILLFVSTAIWLAPFLLMLLIAFSSKNTNSFLELFADNRATFQNFQNAWEQAEFSRYFLNTVIVTVVSVVVILAVTALAGYIMGCFEFRAKKIIYTVMMISMGIPTIFFTIPVYQILRMLHCESSLIGLILAEVGGGHVIFILLFSKFFQSIPKALEESAVLEGASEFDVFFRIMFPLAGPVIGTVVITQSIWTWNSFLYPLILSVNQPKIRTLSVGLYSFQGENIVEWGSIAAGACITILPMLLLFVTFQKYFIQGISGAVKE